MPVSKKKKKHKVHSKLFICALKWHIIVMCLYIGRTFSEHFYRSAVSYNSPFSSYYLLFLLFIRNNKLGISMFASCFAIRPKIAGKMIEDYWGPSLKMLSDFKFLENLKTFDKDNIPPPLIKKIRDKYLKKLLSFY